MGVFTSGLIAVRPIKLKTSFTLEELAERAQEGRYPEYADKRSEGWGSSEDDDAALNVPVVSRFTVGEPQFAQEVTVGEDGETVPRRLRMRYYWDRFDQRMRRTLGDSAPWDRLHVRQGVDVVIFDDETDSGRSVLLSARERSLLTSAPFPALRHLGGDASTIESEEIAEGLDPDLFKWLLWRLQGDPVVGKHVTLESIREISSKDRLLRGARFTDRADLDRIEMAALIAMGKMRFGPAKVGLGVEDLGAVYDLELHPDGGFMVYRSSEYDDPGVSGDQLGHKFAEDLWTIVLPRIRDAYNRDKKWAAEGRDDLKSLAVEAIRRILPPGA
jgi:hypothetical protein